MASIAWDQVARQMVAGLRGGHSRALLSRRLGYRTNTVSDWEAGRRYPSAAEFLRVCELLHVDVDAAFRRFHRATAPRLRVAGRIRLERWLDALRGRIPLQLIAERTGYSRFAVSRWLKGQTRPRLPELLALVGIDKLPALLEPHRRRSAARNLAFELPDSEGLLRIMETEGYQALAVHRPGALAAALGISVELEQRALAALEAAGILQSSAGRYRPLEPLTVDTSAEPAALNRLKAHWTRVALERLEAPREQDWLGYNLMSLSETDLERVQEILRNAYREIRALAAASEPVQRAALLNLQLVTFPIVS